MRVIEALLNVENSWTSTREFASSAGPEIVDFTDDFARDIRAFDLCVKQRLGAAADAGIPYRPVFCVHPVTMFMKQPMSAPRTTPLDAK